MKKTLVILLVICCSTVAYATSVSVMVTAPEITSANSAVLTPTDVSTLLTVVYGDYPQVFGKGGVDYTMNALSASYQQGTTYSGTANMESENTGKGLRTDGGDPSPSPVPEPITLLLVGIGLAVLGFVLRLRR
jgi:hypothetical protein